MEEYPYVQPDFLEGQSADEIHKRMLDNLPDDLDKSELQFAWDFTRPTALEKAEFIQYRLNETVKIIFPQWAYGIYLDMHAEKIGLKRRVANKASGVLTVQGIEGALIPEGFLFATPAENGPSVLFEAAEERIIDENGKADVPVQAVEGGITGNAPKGAVTLMVKPIGGITGILNEEPMTGGSPEEADNLLRERVLEAQRNGLSFVGNDSDYIRWGKNVAGVGDVVVIPEWDGPGTVKLVIVDMNGYPANEQILTAVYEYIVSPGDRLKRLSPIGADVSVVAPLPVGINVFADITLTGDVEADAVESGFREGLSKYYSAAVNEGMVKYVQVASILAQTVGIWDFDNDSLLVNGQKGNVPIGLEEFPVTGEVIFNVNT